MSFSQSQLLALLPLCLTALGMVILMLTIAWRRNVNNAFFVTATVLNLALLSLFVVGNGGPVAVTPLLMVDSYSVLFMAIVLIAALACSTFARAWLKGYPDNCEEFYLLLLIATCGGLVLAASSHLASLFIGIELISLPMFGLVGYAYRQSRSLEAGIKYMVLSATATAFLLFGMALIYAQSGTLSFSGLAGNLGQYGAYSPLVTAGFAMMLVGFAFKLSLAPFHLWTPDVYEGAPAPVAAFLATASKVAIFSALLRFYLSLPLTELPRVSDLLGVLAMISILVGNLLALQQSNIKRMLGFSSVAHMGYLCAVIIACRGHAMAIEAAAVYLLMYLFTSLGAFGVISLVSSPYKGRDADSLANYRGLFWHRPYLSAVLTVTMLSLAGIPMTFGFIGKFYIIELGVTAGLWWLMGAVILGSAIGLYYYLRVMVSLYLREQGAYGRDAQRDWATSAGGIVVLLSAGIVVLLGLYPQPLLELVQRAAIAVQ